MADAKRITLPLTDEVVRELCAGDRLIISGPLYVGRDAAHKRMIEALDRGESLPFDVRGATIYYMGPSPARPGRPMGACGPTTSGRMDAYAPRLVALGLKGMLGKGARSQAVRDALQAHNAVYLGAIGGAGALISKSVTSAEVVAYEDLGPEALLRLNVQDLAVTVIDDAHGHDLYEEGRARYRSTVSSS